MMLNWIQMVFLVCLYGHPPQAITDPDPEVILAESRSVYRTIRDFSAEVEIEIQIDFINIPNKTAELKYKYPDKIKFKSASFLMIPKKGIGFMMFKLLEMEYASIYVGKSVNQGHELHEIKIIPLDDEADVVLATLFIDSKDHLIYTIEATTKDAGFFSTEFIYGEHAPLPQSNRIRFQVDKVRLPLKFLGKVDTEKSKLRESATGEVILYFHQYKLNQGLENELFLDEIESDQ